MRPPAWLTRRASCCTQRQYASNGQPLLFDCHRDHGQSSARGSEFSPCETWLRQPRRRVPWSSTTGKRASPRSRGIATTPPRQEGRGVGTLPETTELETEGKRRVREGVQEEVQEEGDETARTLAFAVPTKDERSLCKSGWTSCSRTFWRKTKRRMPEKGRRWRPRTVTHEGARHGTNSGSDGFSFLRLREQATELRCQTGRRALLLLDRSVDYHPCLLVSSVVTALPFGDVSRSSQFSSVLHSVLHQFSTSEHVQRSHFSCGFVRST